MTTILLPKQHLKDYCRRKQYSLPVYVLTDEEKIDLHKHYTIQVSVNGLITAEGRGLSRRIAEFKAAQNAINLIGQSDSSVFENHGSHKFGRSMIGRSFSVDQISRAKRTDSIPSMISLAIGTGQYDSTTPSIDGIDSFGENGDCTSYETVTNKTKNSKETTQNGIEEEVASSDSIDEGVFVDSSESSSTPSVSSPTSSAASRPPSVIESDRKNTKTIANQSNERKEKTKSLSSSFLSSFFLLSSLRAFSRRSLRRKSNSRKNSTETKAEFSFEDSPQSTTTTTNGQTQSRPTSSTSSNSYSSSSSAFSSNSSISSQQQSTHSSTSSSSSSSSTSGSFTLSENDNRTTHEDGPIVNGYLNLITESIIEEEEEDETNETIDSNAAAAASIAKCHRKESCNSTNICNGQIIDNKMNGNQTIPRSHSSSYVLSSQCPHNHFSIYGPVLCSTFNSNNLTIESTPSAGLLRYCVRMYLPLPYYDIRFDHKFYVICRVILTTSIGCRGKLPITLPIEYKDTEFTARGNGESLREARNMAAQTIIDKLKKAKIYHE
ncbi:hypothetical protein RDWZM_009714 [Blomia tropicalis]|uniref:DRBM domain-containing protein n=1 Tax=Blomia tropicalis TaxID=40697 RepID=A0A9Q0M421_BLOTA|nr:hypothetical protein RDWZM_009714 [Blomia tropicalis]